MSTRVRLDDAQRSALRELIASSSETMSDVVRRAIDRVLADELVEHDWDAHVDALLARVDARKADKPEPSDDDIDAAVARSRARRNRAGQP